MMKKYKISDSLDVASYIAQKCQEKSYTYNITKINKLLYLAYGVVMTETSYVLCNETPRVWRSGPVFERAFYYMNCGGDLLLYKSRFLENATEEIIKLVDEVIDNFGKYGSLALTKFTMEKDGAWDKAYNVSFGNQIFIPNDYIIEWFRKTIN